MILNLVILLICVNKIYSDESEEGKYIDLLPEGEKREFLEKVARRILEEVESKDILKKSGELSDGQLNKHSSYVSQVMKEEKNDIMKRHENDTNLKKKDVRSDASIITNPDRTENGEKSENNDGNGHLQRIDLTLKDGKASVREHETEKRSIDDTLDVSYKPTSEKSTKVANLTVNEKTTKQTIIYETTRQTEAENKNKDGNISIEITINPNNTKKEPESGSNKLKQSNIINIPVQVFYDNTQNGYNIKENVKETISNTQMTTEDVKPDGGEYNYQSREDDHNDETRKTVTVMENYEPKKCWSSEESSKTSTSTLKVSTTTLESQRVVTNCDGKPIKIETTSQWIIIDPTDVTGGIYEQIDITRSKKTNDTDISEKLVANGIITTTEAFTTKSDALITTSSILDIVNSTQVDKPSSNTNAVREVKSTAVVIVNTTNAYNYGTKEVVSEIHTTTVEPSTIIGIPASDKPETTYLQNIENKSLNFEEPEKSESEKPTILITTTKNRFEEIKLKPSSLRLGDVETQDLQKNLLELESKYNEHKIKELNVYEIPPGQPLFIENKPNIPKDFHKLNNQEIITEKPTENGEQPNYVPVYNYSPNNAFFNAYNRLGPNYEDEEANKNSDLISTNVLRVKADSSISFESREKGNKKYYIYNSRPSIKKIRSKILLPPSMPKNKKKRYNPQIYLDDYTDTEENNFFRNKKMHKKRTKNIHKKEKKLKKYKKGQSNEESIQVDEMYVKGSIKNHIDAVRHYLSKKNHFHVYQSPRDVEEKKKEKKSLMWKDPNKTKAKKDKKYRDDSNVPKEDLDTLKDKDVDEMQEEGDRIKEAADDADENEKKHKKRHKKLRWLLRAKSATRDGKSKLNNRPKTGTVDGFHNKPPKHGQGIDLDYYFGRTGPDVSSSSSEDLSFSSSGESSLDRGQNGNLGSIYYSNPRDIYYDYRRNNHQEGVNNPGKVNNNNGGIKPADQTPIRRSSSDIKSKFTMEDLHLVKNISVANDLVPNVLMMQKHLGIIRSGDNNDLKNYLTVISDFIETESKALLQYDWLGSAVDIQSALRKLIDLTEQLNDGDFNVHPSDWELFKYCFYIYETVDLDVNKKLQITRKMLHPEMPTNRMKKEHDRFEREPLNLLPKTKYSGKKKMKRFEPYFSLRAQLKRYKEKLNEKKALLKKILDFQQFLNSVLDNLNDLHDAIKHIGIVSKQKTVKWFKNLKEVYLNNPRKKEMLSVLLHLSMNRVVNLIEESAKEGVERSFVSYVRSEKNALKINRTKEELTFVMSVLRELEKLEN